MAFRSVLALLLLALLVILSLQTQTSHALVATADKGAGAGEAEEPYEPNDEKDSIEIGDAEVDEDGDDMDMALDEDDDADEPDDEDDEEEDEDDEDEDEDEDESEPEVDTDKPAILDPEGEENATGYTAPNAEGALFFDDFQSGLSKWTHTKDSEYGGQFKIGQGTKPTFKGDRALIIPEKAKRYGLSSKVSGLQTMDGKDIVLQYEVKLDQGMTCGGAYLKLPTADFDPSTFNGGTTYSIMFGPDKCGATDKVHFIFQSKNPVTGKMTEHHLKDPPSVANTYDKKTHLYTVIVKSDGKFEVHVDDELKKEGTLSDSFEPPVQPEKEIDDPEDKKPDDWVDDAKIPDPDAVKPDDWDEDAPKKIEDMDAEKPKDWLDDEPTEIPDPEAKKPEEWDDEEDGDWEAPIVPNPKCDEVGCGEWKRPMKDNPDYKGKWSAPLIDNPKYIGVWKPRKIANKDYYDVSNPSLLPISGIGFEIWTMDQGVLFDNIWLGTDTAAAKKFATETFAEKQKTELAREEEENKKAEKDSKKSSEKSTTDSKLGPIMEKIEDVVELVDSKLGPVQDWLVSVGAEPYLNKLIDAGVQKPMLVVLSFPMIIVLLFLIVLGGKKAPTAEETVVEEAAEAAEAAAKKKTDEPTPDTPSDTVEGTDNATAADSEQEKSGVRRRRTATAE